jgi:hypothetical protein
MSISFNTPSLKEHVQNNLQAARRFNAHPWQQWLDSYYAIFDWIVMKITLMLAKRQFKRMMAEMGVLFSDAELERAVTVLDTLMKGECANEDKCDDCCCSEQDCQCGT